MDNIFITLCIYLFRNPLEIHFIILDCIITNYKSLLYNYIKKIFKKSNKTAKTSVFPGFTIKKTPRLHISLPLCSISISKGFLMEKKEKYEIFFLFAHHDETL